MYTHIIQNNFKKDDIDCIQTFSIAKENLSFFWSEFVVFLLTSSWNCLSYKKRRITMKQIDLLYNYKISFINVPKKQVDTLYRYISWIPLPSFGKFRIEWCFLAYFLLCMVGCTFMSQFFVAPSIRDIQMHFSNFKGNSE